MDRIFKCFSSICLLALLSTAALTSPAEARPRGINNRQCRQQRRIGQGVQNGSLTARESGRLERQQARLNKQEARMRQSGGGLNKHERRRLEHEENGLSHNIYQQKHDGQQQVPPSQ